MLEYVRAESGAGLRPPSTAGEDRNASPGPRTVGRFVVLRPPSTAGEDLNEHDGTLWALYRGGCARPRRRARIATNGQRPGRRCRPTLRPPLTAGEDRNYGHDDMRRAWGGIDGGWGSQLVSAVGDGAVARDAAPALNGGLSAPPGNFSRR